MEQAPTTLRRERPFKEILAEVDNALEAERQAGQGSDPQAGVSTAPITDRSVADILTERGKTHGDYTDHATITQMLKRIMRTGKNWDGLSDIMKESLEMNAHKIGRILSGDPSHHDHWDDIAGYAKLVSQRI